MKNTDKLAAALVAIELAEGMEVVKASGYNGQLRDPYSGASWPVGTGLAQLEPTAPLLQRPKEQGMGQSLPFKLQGIWQAGMHKYFNRPYPNPIQRGTSYRKPGPLFKPSSPLDTIPTGARTAGPATRFSKAWQNTKNYFNQPIRTNHLIR